MRRGQVLYDKPISVGFAILDISKLILYKLLYRLKEHYGEDNVEVVYTDTDSLKLYVEGKDVYDTRGIEDIIDTSNFSKITDKPLISGINEKKLGVLKFENADKPMCRLIAPASKSYVEIFSDDSISLTLK